MELHQQLSDQAFADQFAQCTLPPHWFTHTAHLRLAWILDGKHGLEAARRLMCEQIQRFDQTHGDGTKFHRTLTEAAVQVVHHFKQRRPTASFTDLLEYFPRLQTNFRDLLLTHYSEEVLFNPTSGSTYQTPDLMAFPNER